MGIFILYSFVTWILIAILIHRLNVFIRKTSKSSDKITVASVIAHYQYMHCINLMHEAPSSLFVNKLLINIHFLFLCCRKIWTQWPQLALIHEGGKRMFSKLISPLQSFLYIFNCIQMNYPTLLNIIELLKISCRLI